MSNVSWSGLHHRSHVSDSCFINCLLRSALTVGSCGTGKPPASLIGVMKPRSIKGGFRLTSQTSPLGPSIPRLIRLLASRKLALPIRSSISRHKGAENFSPASSLDLSFNFTSIVQSSRTIFQHFTPCLPSSGCPFLDLFMLSLKYRIFVLFARSR